MGNGRAGGSAESVPSPEKCFLHNVKGTNTTPTGMCIRSVSTSVRQTLPSVREATDKGPVLVEPVFQWWRPSASQAKKQINWVAPDGAQCHQEVKVGDVA